MFGRIGGGLLAYFLIDSINGYKWAIIAAVCGAIGFGIAILTDPLGGIFLFVAVILIGFAVGLFWVIVPSIVMEDAGEKNFGLNWGLTLFLNALGMLIFGEVFDWVYEWQAGGSDKCSGGSCTLFQFIAFGILCLIAAGLCFFALSEDEKGNKKDDKKGNKKGDKKGDKKGRDKGKDRKSKSKNKSKSKDKKKKPKK